MPKITLGIMGLHELRIEETCSFFYSFTEKFNFVRRVVLFESSCIALIGSEKLY